MRAALRHVATACVALLAITLAFLPAVVASARGWVALGSLPGSAALAATSPEAWTLFALFYLVWMVALGVALVAVLQHLVRRRDVAERPLRGRQRRVAAGLHYLGSLEEMPQAVAAGALQVADPSPSGRENGRGRGAPG